MLEDNLTSRLPTSGSKCFTHPDIQKKVNTPFLCFTQKNYAENNVCAQWSMGVCGQQALHQQLDWVPVSSRVKHMKRCGGPNKRFSVGLSHPLPPHTRAFMYIDANQTGLSQCFAWTGKGDHTGPRDSVDCSCGGDFYDGFQLRCHKVWGSAVVGKHTQDMRTPYRKSQIFGASPCP